MSFFEGDGDHRYLHVLTHAFPTRRSADLIVAERREKAFLPGTAGGGGSLRGGPVEVQAVARAQRGLDARHIAALGADAKSGEREAGGGDRRKGIARPAAGREAFLDPKIVV